MCGICGKVAFDSSQRVDPALVQRMNDALLHRGPDDEGMYIGGQAVLGHRRLSIIDLQTGKQPIANEDQTVWVVFNGEIYNFKELRQQLLEKGHIFRTNSDTEVIVHLYEEYGENCVESMHGMFAFAVWDAKKKLLLLARDRVGIKPLYYVATKDAILFASEIKALIVDPSVKREVDPRVIDKFLTYLYTPGCDTPLRDVQKLEPGHYLVLQDSKHAVRQYWDLAFPSTPQNGNFRARTAELIDLLRETVRGHMISDVPVGVLLSGGVDSTALLSFVVQQTDQDVKTFTIGFSGEKFADERPYANVAAERFRSNHYEMTITAKDFQDFLPKYVWHMEEPVCEPPAVALYYVTKLAREHVKVLISGEGGDEAFAGYQNYRNIVWVERFKSLGQPWTNGMAYAIDRVSRLPHCERFQKYSPMMQLPLNEYYYSRTAGPTSFFPRTKAELYSEAFRRRVDSGYSRRCVAEYFAHVGGQKPLNQMLYVDTKTWLPDDLLIKADKITMANSLELRVPLLDHKVLEFAARLPASYKVRGFTTKYILKKAFEGRVPKKILHRKKTGFPVPFGSWLRNELRDFVREVLLDSKTLGRGYFEKKAVEKLLSDAPGASVPSAEIFSLVTLELWHRQFLDVRDESRDLAPAPPTLQGARQQ
jgi:asparagine synthase (glutamine-hydrolysing)